MHRARDRASPLSPRQSDFFLLGCRADRSARPRRRPRACRAVRPCAVRRQPGWGVLAAGVLRPYAATSPFNEEIPRAARLAPNSARVVRRLLSFGPLQHLTAGDAGRADDFGRAAYFNHPGDPVSPCTARSRGARARWRAGGSGSPTPPASPEAATATSRWWTTPAAGSTTSACAVQASRWRAPARRMGWAHAHHGDGLGSYAVAARSARSPGRCVPRSYKPDRSTTRSPSACTVTREASSIRQPTAEPHAHRWACPTPTRPRSVRAFSSP